MIRALELARAGQGLVEPNPMVGAVVVRDGQIIGQGFHTAFGQAHAEIEALKDCLKRGNKPAGATVYVTLEPCSHTGKTPPCTKALIEAGIGKVVAAMEDPFKKVAGRGFAQLRAVGIEVAIGDGEKEARELNAPFIKKIKTGLPWVILKWAQTLDGKIATASGDSQWISSEDSRQIVHQLRSRVDAIMVGPDTARMDNPNLTARLPEKKLLRKARRIILDPDLNVSENLKIINHPNPPITIATAQEHIQNNHPAIALLEEKEIEIIGLPRQMNSANEEPSAASTSHLDLEPLMRHLAKEYGATNVLVEGGGKLFGSLIKQKLVDQILTFITPKILGDFSARSGVAGLSCPTIDSAVPLNLHSATPIKGGDILLDYRLCY